MKPRFFAKPAAFRAWLEKNHLTAGELLIGFHKRDSGKASMTWPESVDAALCYGWIDGVRRSLGETSYTIRFTPRRARSIWSTVNITRMAFLVKEGLVRPAGLAAFERRSEDKSNVYAYERTEEAKLSLADEKKFRTNREAWTFFTAQAPSYRRVMTHHVVSAKKEETRVRRLDALIADSAQGKRSR